MFNHLTIGASDIERSRRFYDALFAAIGGPAAQDDPKGRLVYRHEGGVLVVGKPINGEPPTVANGNTIGFKVATAAMVEAWHAAGCEHGGVSAEDPPGPRSSPFGEMYLAYLRDPDGHKLCAVCWL
ncbi:VOC family protein [Qipengyuania mesophila]|uniref:VOC family protein n=1 Tax=Qipengyuania mesophila TaxID=2867246 RepID=UPI0035118221